jgi:hypothetical protein
LAIAEILGEIQTSTHHQLSLEDSLKFGFYASQAHARANAICDTFYNDFFPSGPKYVQLSCSRRTKPRCGESMRESAPHTG